MLYHRLSFRNHNVEVNIPYTFTINRINDVPGTPQYVDIKSTKRIIFHFDAMIHFQCGYFIVCLQFARNLFRFSVISSERFSTFFIQLSQIERSPSPFLINNIFLHSWNQHISLRPNKFLVMMKYINLIFCPLQCLGLGSYVQNKIRSCFLSVYKWEFSFLCFSHLY